MNSITSFFFVPPKGDTRTSNKGSPEASTSAEAKESDSIEKVGVAAEQDKDKEKKDKEKSILWFKTQLEAIDEDKESRHAFFSLPNGYTNETLMHTIYENGRTELLSCRESTHDLRIMALLKLMDDNYRLYQEEFLEKQQTEEKRDLAEEKQAEDREGIEKENKEGKDVESPEESIEAEEKRDSAEEKQAEDLEGIEKEKEEGKDVVSPEESNEAEEKKQAEEKRDSAEEKQAEDLEGIEKEKENEEGKDVESPEESNEAENEKDADSILNAMKEDCASSEHTSSSSESEDEVVITDVRRSKRQRDRKEIDSEPSLSSSSESDSGANIRKSNRVKVKKQNEDFVYATRKSRRVQNLPTAKRVIQRTRSKGKSKVAVAAKGKPQLKHSKKQSCRMPPKKRKPLKNSASKSAPQEVIQVTHVVSPGGKVRRSTNSRPTSISSIKDRVTRPKFEKCTRQMSELHGLTTFAKKEDRDRVPKSHHFMYSYDELVEKPFYAKLGASRDTPISVFFAPEGVDVKELGQVLVNVGKEMMKNNGRNKGKNYVVTNDKDAYSNLIFGEKMTKPKSKNKSSRSVKRKL